MSDALMFSIFCMSEVTRTLLSVTAFKQNGHYLIVGGAGGLGFELAQYLDKHYEAKLTLLGRRPQDEAIEQKLQRLSQAIYLSCDATDKSSLDIATRQASLMYGSINGIINSSMVLADNRFTNMKEEEFTRVLNAKIISNMNLCSLNIIVG